MPLSATEQVLALLQESVPEGAFTVSEVAEKLYAQLEEQHPELLRQWQEEQATAFLKDSLRRVMLSRNARTRKDMRRLGFAAAAETFEQRLREGEDRIVAAQSLKPFTQLTFVVDAKNTRKPVGEMTGVDHKYVAREYRNRERTAGLEAAFHEAVAGKIGNRKTEEVFTEADYIKLYKSITNL